ncbi:MAG: alpha/beta hydrolase [Rhodanobacter sp.]|jgi:pimeloyl-ACP methyl ester carboxylesterase|nr:alpha/beta hydrolase [Rhodanobacter sp.]
MKLRALLLPLLLLYPLYASVMFSQQDRILFPGASGQHYPLAAPWPATGQLVEIPASFGKVRLFYQPPRGASAPAPAVIYVHGNFECIQNSFATLQPLAQAGVGVLQLEYPGYCGADGEISFDPIVESANLAYDWLAARPDVDPQRIIAIGYSIGGGVASELAHHRPVRALVLLSTYTSIKDMTHRYGLPGFLLRYPFDNLTRLREYQGPVFIEHGRNDSVIPFAMGARLAHDKPGREFVALDCGHTDCHFENGALFKIRLPAWLAANGIAMLSEK